MNKAQQLLMVAKSNKTLKFYRKVGQIRAYQITSDSLGVKPGDTVKTIIDGKLETTNTAKDGDYLVVGSKNERYLIPEEKFKSRYKFYKKENKLFNIYVPTGKVAAVQYFGESFTFKAPWGESMICEDGDFIASTITNNKYDINDVYRIEKYAFYNTYKML